MPVREPAYRPIGDYAIIGDCHSAALVSRDGALDWLCLPRFDSPSLFAALLDAENGGKFVVRPTSDFEVRRRYLPDTAVLETTFASATGVARLLDLMSVSSEPEKRSQLQPDHEVLRVIECLDGEIEVEVTCDPRPDYAHAAPRLRDRGPLGFHSSHRAQLLVLRSEIPMQLTIDHSGVAGRERLVRGDRRRIALTFTRGTPAVIPALGAVADTRVARTVHWWRDWAARCSYAGPFRQSVVRSAITLKLLTYAPSGAVVAAPTTSLPETLGGVRNWDYRFCWVRDASLTLQALFDLGYPAEAEAFLSWLLHTTRMTHPELQVIYNVYGEKRLPERELTHLEGYAHSRPVRVGNGAAQQLQLDNYGEVTDAVYEFVARGGRLDHQTARLLVGLGHGVCRRWREPDEGIWEIRSERRHHTYSKAMCWVALDRLVRLHDEGHLRAPVDYFRQQRDAVREDVERHGYNEELGSYTAWYGGDSVDASLLLLARYGFVDPTSQRMIGTYNLVHERLAANGLLYRYVTPHDGLPPGDAAFGICSFWAVETRARQGEVAEAVARFEQLLRLANDVGLFAEEIEPELGTAMGNFPQAFTHVGLIDAALTLTAGTGQPGPRAHEKRRAPSRARI